MRPVEWRMRRKVPWVRVRARARVRARVLGFGVLGFGFGFGFGLGSGLSSGESYPSVAPTCLA